MSKVIITRLPCTLADGKTVMEPCIGQNFVVWEPYDHIDFGRDADGRRNIGHVVEGGFVDTFEQALEVVDKYLAEQQAKAEPPC